MKRFSLALSVSLMAASFQSGSVITIAKVKDIELGFMLGGASDRQWVLNTSGNISGNAQSDYLAGASAGELIITDPQAPSTVQIEASNISGFNGLAVNQVLCSYDNGPESRCDQPGYIVTTGLPARTLKLGIDVVSTQYHFGGDAATVDFEVSVTYL